MIESPRRLALFGGTFDPIHRGHLAAARATLATGLVDRVVFIPAGSPPHKPAGPRLEPEHRWLLAVLATLDEPAFRVARFELERQGPSYAIDTVRQARKAFGLAAEGTDLYWVIGTDAMALIHTWHDVRALFELVQFLVIAREGDDEAALRHLLATTVPFAVPESITFVPMDRVAVSSTRLRAELAQGVISADLPSLVACYIERYGLYREPLGVHS